MDANDKSNTGILSMKADFLSAFTTTLVALPVLIAFGEQSGLGAISGLYGAAVVALIAGMISSSPAQIFGPTGLMMVVVGVIIANQVENFGNLEAAMGSIVAIFILSAVIQLCFGLSGIARYIRYMPYPVISGFRTGIGLVIIILQIYPVAGIATYISPTYIVDILVGLPELVGFINYYAVVLALGTMAMIYALSCVTSKIPGALLAMVLLSGLCAALDWDVPYISGVGYGIPEFKLATIGSIYWRDLSGLFIPALTLALITAVDTLMTAIVSDNLHKHLHDSNRDLIGLGLANFCAALIAGLPGAGAIKRSAVNIHAGGHSRWSAFFHSLLIIVLVLFFGRFVEWIPMPVIAGILITVGFGMIDFKALKHIAYIPKTDSVILILVMLMTVFVDLLQALALGIMLASILFMKKMGDIAEDQSITGSFVDFSKEEAWNEELNVSVNIKDKVFIKHFEGPIFFGFAVNLQAFLLNLPEVEVVILRMSRVPYIDQSGLYAIEDAVMNLRNREIKVLISGLHEQPRDMMNGIGLIPELVSEHYVFKDFKSCIESLQKT